MILIETSPGQVLNPEGFGAEQIPINFMGAGVTVSNPTDSSDPVQPAPEDTEESDD